MMKTVKLFESKHIRSAWDEKEQKWLFSVIDVVGVLTDSPDPKDYWYRIKKREKISGIELSTICRQLKLEAPDGKMRATDCADAEGLLRIIQSIPSPKAEPCQRGFSPQNLWQMRQFFEAYKDTPEISTLLRELPWSSNLHILTKTKREEERGFYLRMAIRNGWQVREVARQIDGALFERTILDPPKALNRVERIAYDFRRGI